LVGFLGLLGVYIGLVGFGYFVESVHWVLPFLVFTGSVGTSRLPYVCYFIACLGVVSRGGWLVFVSFLLAFACLILLFGSVPVEAEEGESSTEGEGDEEVYHRYIAVMRVQVMRSGIRYDMCYWSRRKRSMNIMRSITPRTSVYAFTTGSIMSVSV